jgi:hypothetical protein
MRFAAAIGIIAATSWLSLAQAQPDNGNAIAVPPAPPIVASPPGAPVAPSAPAAPAPPGLTETSLPPPATSDNTDTGTDNGTPSAADTAPAANTAQASAAPAPAPSLPPAVPSDWVSGKTAKIRVLDKVDGSIADLTIPVGGQSVSGDLQVSVLACDLHPPGQLPDDAIFVSIQPSGDPSAPPVYRGWMLRSVPAAAVAGDASETFRVVSCAS